MWKKCCQASEQLKPSEECVAKRLLGQQNVLSIIRMTEQQIELILERSPRIIVGVNDRLHENSFGPYARRS